MPSAADVHKLYVDFFFHLFVCHDFSFEFLHYTHFLCLKESDEDLPGHVESSVQDPLLLHGSFWSIQGLFAQYKYIHCRSILEFVDHYMSSFNYVSQLSPFSFFCFFWHQKINKDSFSEIARLLTDFFRDLDLVPTDIVAGLVLLRKQQKKLQETLVTQVMKQETLDWCINTHG